MYLDKQHPTPVYIQLKKVLQSQIEQGIYVSHQQLPSERYLCQHYNLSRMTVRRALQKLIAEGFAYTRAGKGTFVGQIPNRAVNNSHKNGQSDSLISHISDSRWQNLVAPLLCFDGVGVEQAIRDTLAIHPLEVTACSLFPQLIRHFEQQWLEKKISLSVHNYAITTFHAQLMAMMNAAIMDEHGPKVVLGCTPGDQHEIGLLLLALMLRRRGFRVIYLGPNLTAGEFRDIVEKARPQLICLSAATQQAAKNLAHLAEEFTNNTSQAEAGSYQKTVLAFGGVSFNSNPYLVKNTAGVYLGDTIDQALIKIQNLCNISTIKSH